MTGGGEAGCSQNAILAIDDRGDVQILVCIHTTDDVARPRKVRAAATISS